MPQRIVFDALKITDKNGNDKQIPVIGIQSNVTNEELQDQIASLEERLTTLENAIAALQN